MRRSRFLIYMTLISLMVLFTASAAFAGPWGDFRDLVKNAGPAVVNINTERTEQITPMMPRGFEMFRGVPEMEQFFDHFDEFSSPRTRKSSSLGSGFLITEDGYIVTNNHVIEGADTIRVSMGNRGKEDTYAAEVIGTDPVTDLALIKIDGEGLPFLKFGDSDKTEVGEWVIAIGSPLGLDHTVTAGIISAKGRSIQSGPYDDFLQTDASINRGNSGGPLLNMSGEVVGINTAIAQRAQGIGFAIPSNMANKIIDNLREHKKVSRGWLGVTIQNIDAASAKALGLEKAQGALVNSVLEGEPADKAGITSGDVILTIDGKDIINTERLLRIVADLRPGETVDVVIWRAGQKKTVPLTVAERTLGGPVASKQEADDGPAAARLGIKIRTVTSEDLRRYNLKETSGLFVTGVQDSGLAAEAGIEPGDVILAVNGMDVNTVQEFTTQVEEGISKRGALLLHISRKGQIFFKAIEIPAAE